MQCCPVQCSCCAEWDDRAAAFLILDVLQATISAQCRGGSLISSEITWPKAPHTYVLSQITFLPLPLWSSQIPDFSTHRKWGWVTIWNWYEIINITPLPTLWNVWPCHRVSSFSSRSLSSPPLHSHPPSQPPLRHSAFESLRVWRFDFGHNSVS